MEEVAGISSGSVQGPTGLGFELPDLREDDTNHDREVLLDDL